MCGFTVGASALKLLLCALLFISNISDDHSCLKLDAHDIHTRPHPWPKMSATDLSLKKHYELRNNIDGLYDKDHANSHLAKSNSVRVQSAKSVNLNDESNTRRSDGTGANSTHGSGDAWRMRRRSVSDNATLRLAYANDPFGGNSAGGRGASLSPEGRVHLRLRQRPLELPTEESSKKSKESQKRTKRGVVQLYNMVSCATGCDPLIYKGYGCYCGFLGSGRPVDGIDKCCKMHDICYDVANCPMYLEYVVPYYWKCYRGKSLCAVDHLDLGGSGSCAQRLCECDRLLSECLSRFPCPARRAKCVSSPWRLLQNTLMFF